MSRSNTSSPPSSFPSRKLGAKRPMERFPSWLRKTFPSNQVFKKTRKEINNVGLPTVCEEALCPNRTSCWSRQTATYLALGNICTRKCGFCNIAYSPTPQPPDPQEPQKIVDSAKALSIKHIVITMVSRDDLEDGGAQALVNIVRAIQEQLPETTIEILSSDFQGNKDSVRLLLDAGIDIFNHNVETVRRLSPYVRHKATYQRSLEVLETAAQTYPNTWVKSGIMVGLGEQETEVRATLKDLASVGVKIVTIGQYLQPNRLKIPVKEYVTPNTFDYYQSYGESLGLFVYSGPFVRSSYNADLIFDLLRQAPSQK